MNGSYLTNHLALFSAVYVQFVYATSVRMRQSPLHDVSAGLSNQNTNSSAGILPKNHSDSTARTYTEY